MRTTDRLQPILLLAAFKIAIAALIGVVALMRPQSSAHHSLAPVILLGQLAVMGGAGIVLVARGRRDQRAFFLGCICLLLAAAFTPSDTFGLHRQHDKLSSNLLFLFANLRIELYLAPFLGLFVRNFPAVPLSFSLQSRFDRLIGRSWGVVAVVLIGHLGWLIFMALERPVDALSDPTQKPTLFLLIVLTLTALAFLAWRARSSPPHRAAGEVKRRGRVFIVILCGGAAGAVVVLLTLLTPARALLDDPTAPQVAAVFAFHAFLAAVALALAWAVLAKRLAVFSDLPRKVLQPQVARLGADLLLAVSFAAVAAYLFEHRELRLIELFSARHLTVWIVAAVGGLGLVFRRRMLDVLERHVFPGQFNARRILAQLPEQIRNVRELEQLANLISHGVTLAWGLDRAGLLVTDPEHGELIDPNRELPPLDRAASLVEWVETTRRPFEIDLETDSMALRRLPENELHWLVDCRIRFLVPAFAMDGQLNALIVLGAKADEQPFRRDDRQLLVDIGAGAGLVVELLELKRRGPGVLRESAGGAYGMSEEILTSNSKAAECLSCGRVYPPGTPLCRKCDLDLAEALVPYALRRMFRFEERIGIGGMAVVYRATDLNLGRPVAVKTLPRVSPEAAVRLQREARTAATVSHPGLAAIYGIETWEGTPMLILELLESGTLSDRMMEGPVPPRVVLETGMIVAQALEVIHNLGILHRDIKPSNIGFTRHGAAKLLDFGIARIYQDLRTNTEDLSEVLTMDGRSGETFENVTGTLCYFSPEALDEKQPEPSFDLWSLNVVLYEALTARNLFYTPRLKDMVEAIHESRVPDLRKQIPDCPPELDEFFKLELNTDKSVRSQTGEELYRRLDRVLRVLSPQPSGEFSPAVSA